MKPKISLKVAIPALVIFLAVIGYVAYHNSFSKPGGAPLLFQPDSQILNQAVDGTSRLSDNGSTTPDNPIGANSNNTPYVYDATVCQNAPSLYGCLSSYYEGLVKNYGVNIATSDIKRRSADSAATLSQCHPLMHVIGRASVDAYKNISDAFAHGDSFCWSGYYHGIMEGMVEKIGLKNLPTELNNICASIPGKATYSFNYFNCVHGLGHGIMALLGDEVFDSLKMCDSLTGNWEEESCYGGVYMQNIIDSTNVADTDNVVKYLKPSEPLYPCTAVEDKYKGQCYLGQTSYALQVTNYDYKKVFDLCSTVAEPYRDICNQSMGRDVANQAMHDAERTKAMCGISTDPTAYSNCVIGAVKEIISYYHAETQALGFCNILDPQNKQMCTNTANAYYKQF